MISEYNSSIFELSLSVALLLPEVLLLMSTSTYDVVVVVVGGNIILCKLLNIFSSFDSALAIIVLVVI